jgi:beta-lactamase superfamily II metal-dependent hydrolase
MATLIKYAGFPMAFIYAKPESKSKKLKQLLWGERVVIDNDEGNGWLKVHVRGQNTWKKENDKWLPLQVDGYMKTADLQDEKLLEVYFVDIGQGDGAMIITPDDKRILIDAGEDDNMARFLRWKFNTKKANQPPFKFHHTIISHSDDDHYGGFQELFEDPKFEFENVYHNGLIERTGKDLFGEISNGFQTEIITSKSELMPIINNSTLAGSKKYPKLLKTVANRGAEIKMLCNLDNHLSGFESGNKIEIQVLGPVPVVEPDGKRKLKRFDSNDGKTKNGNSIILKLIFKNLRLLLGGDLNVPAENYILEHYSGIKPIQGDESKNFQIIQKVKPILEVDVAKSCHHGSADFTTLFLRALNPIATVISSGDNEPHAHPRPETLGAIGKYSRGDRPLIFSTEMARSAKESIKKPSILRSELIDLNNKIDKETDLTKKEKLKKKLEDLINTIDRTVTVYGMINLRSDGEKVVIAQRLEAKAARGDWDYCVLKSNSNGVLEFVPNNSED